VEWDFSPTRTNLKYSWEISGVSYATTTTTVMTLFIDSIVMRALNFPFVDTYSSIIIESLTIKKDAPRFALEQVLRRWAISEPQANIGQGTTGALQLP
jgi:hypothetical protein